MVRPDDGSIHEGAELVFVGLEPKLLEDRLPTPGLSLPMEPVVDGLPVAVPLRQVTPLNACANAPDDGVDEVPVAALGVRS